MRGKCATCEFYDSGRGRPHWGECHVRSAGVWPSTFENDWCGEHMPQSIQLDPPEDLPEVHTGTRVEKSMGERVEEPS